MQIAADPPTGYCLRRGQSEQFGRSHRRSVMRRLDDQFMRDLEQDGPLHPLLKEINRDRDLSLEIRGNYFNVYFRGYSIAKVDRGGLVGCVRMGPAVWIPSDLSCREAGRTVYAQLLHSPGALDDAMGALVVAGWQVAGNRDAGLDLAHRYCDGRCDGVDGRAEVLLFAGLVAGRAMDRGDGG